MAAIAMEMTKMLKNEKRIYNKNNKKKTEQTQYVGQTLFGSHKYATTVWVRYHKNQIDKIEKVQRRPTYCVCSVFFLLFLLYILLLLSFFRQKFVRHISLRFLDQTL
jgi:hypothetical protein